MSLIGSRRSALHTVDTSRLNKAGFTLIELLVVTGIISVLAGLLVPALAAARRRAQLIACESNLRQLGQAAAIYMGDSGGWLPTDAISASEAFFAPHLGKILKLPAADETRVKVGPYTGPRVQVDPAYCAQWLMGQAIFKCPAVQDSPYPLHYAVNSMDSKKYARLGVYAAVPRQKLNGARNLGNTVYLVEANLGDFDPADLGQYAISRPNDLPYYFPPNPEAGKPTPKPHMIRASDTRHGGRTAVLFLDWHVNSRSLADAGDWPERMLNLRAP